MWTLPGKMTLPSHWARNPAVVLPALLHPEEVVMLYWRQTWWQQKVELIKASYVGGRYNMGEFVPPLSAFQTETFMFPLRPTTTYLISSI